MLFPKERSLGEICLLHKLRQKGFSSERPTCLSLRKPETLNLLSSGQPFPQAGQPDVWRLPFQNRMGKLGLTGDLHALPFWVGPGRGYRISLLFFSPSLPLPLYHVNKNICVLDLGSLTLYLLKLPRRQADQTGQAGRVKSAGQARYVRQAGQVAHFDG